MVGEGGRGWEMVGDGARCRARARAPTGAKPVGLGEIGGRAGEISGARVGDWWELATCEVASSDGAKTIGLRDRTSCTMKPGSKVAASHGSLRSHDSFVYLQRIGFGFAFGLGLGLRLRLGLGLGLRLGLGLGLGFGWVWVWVWVWFGAYQSSSPCSVGDMRVSTERYCAVRCRCCVRWK